MRRTLPLSLTVAAFTALVCAPAAAGELKGLIKLPSGFTPAKSFDAPGFWLLPNDVLALRRPFVAPRMEMVVAVEGSAIPHKTVLEPKVTIRHSRLSPPVLPVKPNAKITFENKDATLHNLEPVEGTFMSPKRLGEGDTARQALEKPGVYHYRCSEVPHVRGTIVVVDAPQFTLPDKDGRFVFPDLPNGAFTIKIWYDGAWIHSEAVSVRGRSRVEIQLKRQPENKE